MVDKSLTLKVMASKGPKKENLAISKIEYPELGSMTANFPQAP